MPARSKKLSRTKKVQAKAKAATGKTTAKAASKKAAGKKPIAKAAASKAIVFPARTPSGRVPFDQADASLNNLNKIDHIVVLMLENRSFDHILGYLKLDKGRNEVDGLTGDMANEHNGQSHPIRRLTTASFEPDPCHAPQCVLEQLSNNNGGFVDNFANTYPAEADPGKIMGYYTGEDLPAYDHIAEEFTICDRWFAPVAGQTWPNRLYALIGKSDGSKENKKPLPIYNLPSFVRQLDKSGTPWRWYCHEVSTLRLADRKYSLGHDNNFFFFDKKTLFEPVNFLDHAAAGDLAAVSWIDPNFVDVPPNRWAANDDHPPANIMAGQRLALTLYNAVMRSPAWEKTMLIIVYDEHGGFFDHVPPPEAADDNPQFRSYGVRVPALIVSPWAARRFVSHTVFDHTSIIKTLLLRFCQKDGTIPNLGARVTNANHLGGLLTEATPRPPLPPEAYQDALARIAEWRAKVEVAKMMAPTEAARPLPKAAMKKSSMERALIQYDEGFSEFEEGLIAARRKLAREGLQEGKP